MIQELRDKVFWNARAKESGWLLACWVTFRACMCNVYISFNKDENEG